MQAQALGPWLDSLATDGRPRVLVGATGHLVLSPTEERQAALELERAVLPRLADSDPSAEVLVVTGMAPGADLLFGEVAAARLAREGRRLRRIGLLPVPVEALWTDWQARAALDDPVRLAAMRERFDRALGACDTLVQLWAEPAPDWADERVRQRQYRRLAAALVQQSDVLVAVVRAGHVGQPGGAQEVVSWRQGLAPVPAELSSGPRRHRSGWPGPDALLLVDPSSAAVEDPGAALRAVRDALREGNYLLAYDRVVKAELAGHRSDELTYLRLLALANAGSTQAVLRRFEQLPAELREKNEDWLALEGRLYKDLAQAGGPDAVQHYRQSAERYHAAFEKTGGYFSAINAASMSLFAGDRGRSRELAQAVLAQLPSRPPGSETEEYYQRATEAEAALLLGDEPRARAALARADALARDNLNARGRTRKQLRLVCRALRLDDAVVQVLRMPPVAYLPPAAPGQVPAAATASDSAFLYAGVTQPAELEQVEARLPPGARLHLVLAAPHEATLAYWRTAHGPSWSERLAALLGRAADFSVARGFLPCEDAWSDRYVDAMALGLSRLAAQRLGSEWLCLGDGAADRRDDDARDLGRHRARAPVAGVEFERCFAGVIFADFAGFSRLHDTDLPLFWARFMRAIGAQLEAHRAGILLQHTWGDALHVVTATASQAAQLSCDIQDCVERLRPSLPEALSRLELRLSAHYAPVFAGPNPIEGEQTYFGTPLSLTARIEPVTPPGMIFVTEALAAQVTLESPGTFALEYAGDVTLAKAYGRSRLFNLRRLPRSPA